MYNNKMYVLEFIDSITIHPRESVELNDSDNEITSDDVSVFFRWLSLDKSTTHLHVVVFSVDDDNIGELLLSLRINNTLRELILEDTSLTNVGWFKFREFLESGECNLSRLLIENNYISDEGAKSVVEYNATFPNPVKLHVDSDYISRDLQDLIASAYLGEPFKFYD